MQRGVHIVAHACVILPTQNTSTYEPRSSASYANTRSVRPNVWISSSHTAIDDALQMSISVVKYSRGEARRGFAVTAMGYDGSWDSTDQIPLRATRAGWPAASSA